MTHTLAPTFGQERSGQAAPARSAGAVLDIRIRLQKSINLYAENGITVQYTHPKLASNNRLYIGTSYVSSRLGIAFHSNAIKQDNYLLSASYYFRPKWLIQPVYRRQYQAQRLNRRRSPLLLPVTAIRPPPLVG
ncbi:hypothetical protein [Spirosoma flavum]|uniref:Uncharacterized protein n=1 Tax=Spirosoma flavum TaxID=2048557 RepID=A0ABW6AMZ9_9BACT